jgi:hypothetical protein
MHRLFRVLAAITFAGALAPALAVANPFVPKSALWARWERHGEGVAVDYRPWAEFLQKYRVIGRDGIARLRYGRVSTADRDRLDRFVASLEAAPVDRMTRAEQKAYWINLYNAATVRLVLAHYPVSSIRKIDGGLLALGPWGRPLLSVAKERLSLNDIEHRILRPIHRDARIHYAVNCAALGCPDLAAAPFDAARIDAQLDAAARGYINHPRGFRRESGKLVASSIFSWYAVDFGGDTGALTHARRYANEQTLTTLAASTRADRHSYDWNLNDAP